MDWIIDFRETKVGESCVPIRFKLDQRDSLNMRYKQVSIGIQKANTVNRGRELDLTEELFIQIPDPDNPTLIRCDYQPAELVRINSCDLAVMLLLVVLRNVVNGSFQLSISRVHNDLFLIEFELKHL